jgi:hypothetical protein
MNIADILGYIDSLKRQYGGTLSDIAANPKQGLLGVGDKLNQGAREWNRDMTQQMGGLLSVRPEVQEQSMEGLLGTLPMPGGINAIRAFHGSPHKFDKFDLSKMGTGEGAQAYGWGGYVAESPGVAMDYKLRLSQGKPATIEGGKVRAEVPAWLANKIDDNGIDWAVNEWTKRVDETKAGIAKSMQPWLEEEKLAGLENTLTALRAVKAAGVRNIERPGNLYELDLRWPDAAREAADPMGPQHFLDWDKPLSQQGAGVRESVAKFLPPAQKGVDPKWGDLGGPFDPSQEYTGQQVLSMLRPEGATASNIIGGGGRETAEKLRNAGIPGIRYLDAGSRGAGEGTANYVVFDDAIIELLKRNGIDIPKGK